jgi:hypothetical protein
MMRGMGIQTWKDWGDFLVGLADHGTPVPPRDFEYWSVRMFHRMTTLEDLATPTPLSSEVKGE